MTPQPHPPAPRKAMRKGTHSCYECRRRKVRCIFVKNSATCEGCAARDKICTEQKRELVQAAGLDTREGLRARVARLEATIQALSSGSVAADPTPNPVEIYQPDIQPHGLGSESSSLSTIVGNPTPVSISSPPGSISNSKDPAQNIDPIATLFDNAIWRRRRSDVGEEPISKIAEVESPVATTKRMRTRELLISNFMPPTLVGMIINATCSWWHTWRPLGPWMSTSLGASHTSTLPDFVLWAFESPDPSIVGLGILCVAVSLQQLDTRVHQYIIRQLPRLPGALFQEYFEKVDRFIINDADYASTEEGIGTIILASKIYMNLGLHKKCWILIHQAITYGQLLGFHRPERSSARETDEERCRRNEAWLSLCAGDVYSSLLLGLPYAADGRTIPITQSQHSPTALLNHNLIMLSAQVIDRNQRGLSLSVSRTEEIQKEIEMATKDLDESFWNAPATLASGRITRQEYLGQIAAQCWLHQLLVLLHMPLMIHSIENAQLEKHRGACLDASRNLLKIYHTMRSDAFSAFSLVKLIDYQAFVCSALLVLGLLGYGSSTHEASNQDKDRDLIGLAIATLRQASGTVNNTIASQAVEGLESLMLMTRPDCPHKKVTGAANLHAKIVVPYVGTITISPGGYYTNRRLVESTSSDANPHLAYNLSHDVFQEPSSLVNEPSAPATNTGLDGVGASGMEFWNNLHPELASIDFDWASTITPNFEADWAWLNDLNS